MTKYNKINKLFEDLYKENFSANIPAYELVMLYSILDETIIKDVEYFCTTIKNINSAESLNNLYDKFYKKYQELNLDFIKDDVSENNLKIMIKLNIIAMLLDNSLEYSNLQHQCIKQLKDQFGEDSYLEKIAKADKENLSIDAKKFKQNIQVQEQPECLKIYVALKEWNDKLHYLMVNNFEKNMSTCAEYLGAEYQNNFDRVFEVLLNLLEKFYNKKLCGIDEICPLILLNNRNFLVKNFGGKVLGLAILRAYGFDIPNTWALSCGNVFYDLKNLEKNINYAVRSSANAEDGESKSFAGMFDTYLNVDYANLVNSINKVKDSINNERLLAYANKFKDKNDFKMAVIIQEFKEPSIAGVWLGNDEEAGFLEWVKGNGEKLVSGKITPTSEDWSNNEDNSHSLCCGGKFVGEILKNAQIKLFEKYKHLADIEFCIVDDCLKFLQFRPVTKVVKKSSKQVQSNKEKVVKGIPCSNGVVTGKVHFISDSTKDTFLEGEILFVEYTSPEMIDVMLKSKGIISLYGGFLCHAGIIAREFDIPCICGVGYQNKEALNNKKVKLDAKNGIIEILD